MTCHDCRRDLEIPVDELHWYSGVGANYCRWCGERREKQRAHLEHNGVHTSFGLGPRHDERGEPLR